MDTITRTAVPKSHRAPFRGITGSFDADSRARCELRASLWCPRHSPGAYAQRAARHRKTDLDLQLGAEGQRLEELHRRADAALREVEARPAPLPQRARRLDPVLPGDLDTDGRLKLPPLAAGGRVTDHRSADWTPPSLDPCGCFACRTMRRLRLADRLDNGIPS